MRGIIVTLATELMRTDSSPSEEEMKLAGEKFLQKINNELENAPYNNIPPSGRISRCINDGNHYVPITQLNFDIETKNMLKILSQFLDNSLASAIIQRIRETRPGMVMVVVQTGIGQGGDLQCWLNCCASHQDGRTHQIREGKRMFNTSNAIVLVEFPTKHINMTKAPAGPCFAVHALAFEVSSPQLPKVNSFIS